MYSTESINLHLWTGSCWIQKKITNMNNLVNYSCYPIGVVENFASFFQIDCDDILKKVKSWRASQPELGVNLDRINATQSFVRRDTKENKNSEDPHIFDSFCLSMTNNDFLSESCGNLFDAMKTVDSYLGGNIRGIDCMFPGKGMKLAFRPQIIHYPSNGGYFSWHKHDLVPQQYGLIVNLSKKNRDYLRGSTKFKMDGIEVSIDNLHDQGALAFFKYDIEHCVESIEGLMKSEEVDWKSGRWSAIMPVL